MKDTGFDDRACREIQRLLPDHLDGTLSAHRAWDVEKHLATCAGCAAEVREMQAVIGLLRDFERFDTSDDFMANLHARLDGVEPAPVGFVCRAAAFREWLYGASSGFAGRRTRAVGLGMAAAALVAVVFVGTRTTDTRHAASAVVAERVPTQALVQKVVAAAKNPFEDPVAANVEAETALTEGAPDNNDQELN